MCSVAVWIVVLGRFKERIETWSRDFVESTGLIKVLPRNPNTITLTALLIASITPLLIITGSRLAILVTLILLSVSSALDALDGLVARYWGRVTARGSFLDSTLDRYVDFISMIDLWLLAPSVNNAILLSLALLGSFMTSYVRARAESLGLDLIGHGLVERGERLLIVLATVLVYLVTQWGMIIEVGLLVLAVLSNATAVQRIITVSSRLG